MHLEESKTVITVSITLPDAISNFTHRTANESTEFEMINEVFRQLTTIIPVIQPTKSILSPGVHKINNKWITYDTAFIYTKLGYAPKNQYKNVYWVGPHNGFSNYNFTSMESAMENALVLAHHLDPRISIPKKQIVSVKLVIYIISVIIIILFIYKYYHGT